MTHHSILLINSLYTEWIQKTLFACWCVILPTVQPSKEIRVTSTVHRGGVTSQQMTQDGYFPPCPLLTLPLTRCNPKSGQQLLPGERQGTLGHVWAQLVPSVFYCHGQCQASSWQGISKGRGKTKSFATFTFKAYWRSYTDRCGLSVPVQTGVCSLHWFKLEQQIHAGILCQSVPPGHPVSPNKNHYPQFINTHFILFYWWSSWLPVSIDSPALSLSGCPWLTVLKRSVTCEELMCPGAPFVRKVLTVSDNAQVHVSAWEAYSLNHCFISTWLFCKSIMFCLDLSLKSSAYLYEEHFWENVFIRIIPPKTEMELSIHLKTNIVYGHEKATELTQLDVMGKFYGNIFYERNVYKNLRIHS